MRALIIIILACSIFGSAGYFTWLLFIKPEQDLRLERSLPPPTPPPDPTVPEYNKRVTLHEQGKLLEARQALREFIERYPESTKIEEAKNRLGKINTDIFLSPLPAPEKQTYVVKSGDVLGRVAGKLGTTPELLIATNDLKQIMLRIGQKLSYAPHDFTVLIDRRQEKVVLLDQGRFFAQYPILVMPEDKKVKGGRPMRQSGQVSERMSWADGSRVTYADEEFQTADHWIVISVPGYTLYSHREAAADEAKPQKPPTGLGLAPDDMHKLALLLRKNIPVIIE